MEPTPMFRPLIPLAFAAAAIVVAVALPHDARAADLAARQSRIGALFAEPLPRGRRVVVAEKPKPVEEPIVSYAPEVGTPSIVQGYYGKPNSYYYRSYYGTSRDLIFSRAPYGCGGYGYC
jgi:hypothetical protein